MENFKRFLVVVGIVAILLFLALLILGIRIAGTIFFWILAALAVMFLAGWVIYLIGRTRGRKDVTGSEMTGSEM